MLDAFDQMELDELLGPPGTAEPEPRVRLSPDEWPWGSAVPGEDTAIGLDAATAEPGELSDAALLEGIVGFERLAGWAQARQARLLAELARRRPGDDPTMAATDKPCSIGRFAPDEVGLALHLSRLTAKARLGRAVQPAEVLPPTLHAWQQGLLDERRVTAICDATLHLPAQQAQEAQRRVLDRAPEQTLAQLEAALKRAVLQADPEGAHERHRAARRDRRVAVGDEQDGMASLWALLSATDARSCFQWLTRLARGCGQDDPRGMDARRANLLVGLLTGTLVQESSGPDAEDDTGVGTAGGGGPRLPAPQPVNPGKPLVHVLMPFTTLLGLDEQACELAGHGPIPAELAREIASDATLKRLVFDPLSGALLDHGRTTYRPPAALADFVRARDVRCRGPVCCRRVIDSELDHVIPYPNGPTSEKNLMAESGTTTTPSTPRAGGSARGPAGGSSGSPPPDTGTPATPTTTGPTPGRRRYRGPTRRASLAFGGPSCASRRTPARECLTDLGWVVGQDGVV
ncbi:HNH endonuclease, partial [Pseudonocardia zijingensis]